MKKSAIGILSLLVTVAAFAVPHLEPTELAKFQGYFKKMGDPKFFMISSSDAMDAQFVEFFTGLGMRIVREKKDADYELVAVGKFFDAINEDEERGIKLSMTVSITGVDNADVIFSVKNDPKKASTFMAVGEERRREIVIEKAFKQMEMPLLTEFKAMAERRGVAASTVVSASTNVDKGAKTRVTPSDVEIVIMEEPFALGQMKVADAFGTGLEGGKYFYQNYTVLQRKVRDTLVKLATTMSFDVKLLEGNELYDNFKTKDATLVGFYFDVETDEFKRDMDLMTAVRDNNPDALILYYRVDALSYDKAAGKVRAAVALNLRNPGNNTTRPVGMKTLEYDVKPSAKDVVMDEVATKVAETIRRLWVSDGAGATLLKLTGEIAQAATADKGPVRLTINASVFDAKDRKKMMYNIKKALLGKGLCKKSEIKSTNNAIRATISKEGLVDPEEVYMEHISPILEELGVELTDDQVNYAGSELTITPGK